MKSMVVLGVLMFAMALVDAKPSLAECCNVSLDASDTEAITVRFCEMPPPGGCGPVLFEGDLAPGESIEVCSATDAIAWEILDPATGEAGPVQGSECDGHSIEL